MRSVKSLIAAGAASLLSSAAFAADMPIAAPPMYAPPIVEDFGGWYLRGDIGFSNQRVKSVNPELSDPGISVASARPRLRQRWHLRSRRRLRVNNWFRADVTGEYRGNANLRMVSIIVSVNGVRPLPTNYHASKSEWLVLANAYVDLGTWWCVTPFIGAGVGGSRNTISNFIDVNTPEPGRRLSPDVRSGISPGRCMRAGLQGQPERHRRTRLPLSWISATASPARFPTFDRFQRAVGPMQFKDITSHDLKFGVRWDLSSPAVYAPPPLMRNG